MYFYEWGKRVGRYYPGSKTYLRYGSYKLYKDNTYGISARICDDLRKQGCQWVVIRGVGCVALDRFFDNDPKEEGMEPQRFVKEEHFERS